MLGNDSRISFPQRLYAITVALRFEGTLKGTSNVMRPNAQNVTGYVNGFSPTEVAKLYSLTGCSNPGILRLDLDLLARFHPEWFPKGPSKLFQRIATACGRRDPIPYIKWQLLLGDRGPAIVVSQKPFIVAAYSEELDGIAMLEFDAQLIEPQYRALGTKLITLNLDYSSKFGPLAADLHPGPNCSGRWTNFLPLIGDFLSRDKERLAQLLADIPTAWWSRLATMVKNYDHRFGIRDGRPGLAAQPAIGDQRWNMFDRGQ